MHIETIWLIRLGVKEYIYGQLIIDCIENESRGIIYLVCLSYIAPCQQSHSRSGAIIFGSINVVHNLNCPSIYIIKEIQ